MEKERHKLGSWKEIADYLGINVRTAYRWERDRELPVHRIPGSPAGRVFAYTAELDRWLHSREDTESPNQGDGGPAVGSGSVNPLVSAPAAPAELDGNDSPAPAARQMRRGMLLPAAAVLAIALIVGGVLLVTVGGADPPVTRLQLEGKILTAFGARGKILWRKEFGQPLIQNAIHRMTSSLAVQDAGEPPYRIVDLDDDLRGEVLVMTGNDSTEFASFTLHCLNADGSERWRYNPGETLTFGRDKINADWRIEYFFTDDLDGDNRSEIILNSRHVSFFPARITVLESDGTVRCRFTNGGWIYYLGTHDLDGDGRKEVLCAGTNNGYRKGVLAVLDAGGPDTAFPQPDTPEHRCPSLPAVAPKYYLLFPRDCLNQRFSEVDRGCLDTCQVHADQVWLRQETRIPMLRTSVEVIFILDRALQALQATFVDGYEMVHQELYARGKLDHPFSPAEIELREPALTPASDRSGKPAPAQQFAGSKPPGLEPILYWDGERFTATPTMNHRWSER